MAKRKLTRAEQSKRDEIAESIHRKHPSMPLAKKYRIATAAAKKMARKK